MNNAPRLSLSLSLFPVRRHTLPLLTDGDIRGIGADAARAGDDKLVAICHRARCGSMRAIRHISRMVRDGDLTLHRLETEPH